MQFKKTYIVSSIAKKKEKLYANGCVAQKFASKSMIQKNNQVLLTILILKPSDYFIAIVANIEI